jgi:hypothetical protein
LNGQARQERQGKKDEQIQLLPKSGELIEAASCPSFLTLAFLAACLP